MPSIYATLDQLKARLGLRVNDSRDDEALEGILEAMSRAIDSYCGTRFYVADSPEARDFTATSYNSVLVDDLLSVTALATDGGDGTYPTSWAASDYVLAPPSAAAQGRPYWQIVTALGGAHTFSSSTRGVRVTGNWGYSVTVPKIVETVCLRESVHHFHAIRSPYGLGGPSSLDVAPQVLPVGLSTSSKSLLGEYRRLVFA